MGQKVHPLILRIGFIRDWQSNWFAPKKDYARYIDEDKRIRDFIKQRYKQAAVARVIIERLSDKIRIRIQTARPGVIIGRHGADIDRLREDLKHITNKEFVIDIEEVKVPALNAQLVAESVAFQLEKRIAFRRAMKRAIDQSMGAGAKGIRIAASGRLGGAEMCRKESYKQGKIPLQTLRADIDYGFAQGFTTYGIIGVKCWIYKGEAQVPSRKTVQQDTQLQGDSDTTSEG